MTLGALYRSVRQTFRDAGFDTPELDAKLLISYALGCAPDDVILKPEMPFVSNAILEDAIARHLNYEPISKITGTRGFYGLDFYVTQDVLDPRADTETLVDAARRHIENSGNKNPRILDICTGTGCIPLALLSVFQGATAIGVDISEAALDVANANIKKTGFANRMSVMRSNWLGSVDGTFDVITCNPPYIPSADINALHDNVRLYDPLIALDGGADGLEAYGIVFPQIRKHLVQNGIALFEIGINQANDVTRLAADCGLRVSAVLRDLGDVERVVCVHN